MLVFSQGNGRNTKKKKKSVNTFSVLMIACISNTSLIAKLIFNEVP